MKASISQSPAFHVAVAAVLAFVAVAGPAVASNASDGFSASDLHALNAIVGAGVAAAIRAALLFVPASSA